MSMQEGRLLEPDSPDQEDEVQRISSELRNDRNPNRATGEVHLQASQETELPNIDPEKREREYPDAFQHSGFELPEDEGRCNLRFINRYPWRIDEEIYVERPEGYVVKTFTRHSHDVRNMAVFGEHGRIPSSEELEQYVEVYEDLIETTAGQIRASETANEMVINVGLNNTPDYPHVMATDLSGLEPDEVNDLKRTGSYIRFNVEDGVEPEEYRIRDAVGAALLGPLHDASEYGQDWEPYTVETT